MQWLVLLVGPVGSGKTTFARLIEKRASCAIISNDSLRREIFPIPSYSPQESRRVYSAAMQRIQQALENKQNVIYDGVNLSHARRAAIWREFSELAVIVPVVMCSPEHVMHGRMRERDDIQPTHRENMLWWDVYQELRAQMEPLQAPHLLIDSSQPYDSAITIIASLLATQPARDSTRADVPGTRARLADSPTRSSG